MAANLQALQKLWRERPTWFGRSFAGVLLVFVIVLPFLINSSGLFITNCVYALAYSVMALGLNVMVGFAGLLDLGYLAFYAFGSFAVGWFASGFFTDKHVYFLVKIQHGISGGNLPGIHLNFFIVIILAIAICALMGTLIGLPTLRLRGDYIAIVTLAFGEIIRVVAVNGDSLHLGFLGLKNGTLTNGRQGIEPLDSVRIPGIKEIVGGQIDLKPWYWLALAMLIIALFVVTRLRDSRLGRAWVAIREDEVAAASMGVPLVRTKLLAYGVGAALGGMAGAFFGYYLSTVNADEFQFSFSIFILSMVILGGIGSVWGVVLGATLLSFINYYFIPHTFNNLPKDLGLSFSLSELGFGVFGFLLVIVMILRPEGLLPERRHRIEMAETDGSLTDESVYEVQM